MANVNLNVLQDWQSVFQRTNFPDTKSYQCLLGVTEEVGELAHSHLKQEQGIKGTDEEHHAKIKDAIGDIVIFLAGYCNCRDIDLSDCVKSAWDVVANRKYEKTGTSCA